MCNFSLQRLDAVPVAYMLDNISVLILTLWVPTFYNNVSFSFMKINKIYGVVK